MSLGDHSVTGCATNSKGNTINVVNTGGGTGTNGNITFQESILKTIESIIQNNITQSYKLPTLKISTTATPNDIIKLFYKETASTQSEAASKDALISYLIFEDYTVPSPSITFSDYSADVRATVASELDTFLTDVSNKAKLQAFVVSLVEKLYQTTKENAKLIQETSEEDQDNCDETPTGRKSSCITACNYSIQIAIM